VNSHLQVNRHIGLPTPDLIDVFVIKNISSNYIKIEESLDLNSDHSPTVSDNIIIKNQNPVLTNKQTGIASTTYWNVILIYQSRLKPLIN
jgi:hypothetical protein